MDVKYVREFLNIKELVLLAAATGFNFFVYTVGRVLAMGKGILLAEVSYYLVKIVILFIKKRGESR